MATMATIAVILKQMFLEFHFAGCDRSGHAGRSFLRRPTRILSTTWLHRASVKLGSKWQDVGFDLGAM